MSVPQSIRDVSRPPNTTVCDTGRDTSFRYIVRKVVKVLRPDGKVGTTPGKTVGYIINNEFREKVEEEPRRFAMRYGDAIFAYHEAQEIFEELKASFPIRDAYKIITIALLRVIIPRVDQKTVYTHYNSSYLSIIFPNVPLSKNTVCNFIHTLGMKELHVKKFFALRISKVVNTDLVLIDTTYKQDTSKINSMSQFSYKSIKKGIPGISVLYAYDVDKEEPICAQAYPGNFIDTVSFKNFVKKYNLEKGIIVADKGFSRNVISSITNKRDDLHYISPLKRNEKIITEHDMLKFENTLDDFINVLYKKKKVSDELFLYSYRDVERARKEEMTYLKNSKKNGTFDIEEYEKKLQTFGTIVFASDLDLDSLKIYQSYLKRWYIELMFKQFKHDLGLDTTNVQTEVSINGAEFINFVSTVISSKLTQKFKNLGWLDEHSYGDIMDTLAQIKRYNDAPEDEIPDKDDKFWGDNRESLIDMLVEAGLCTNKFAEPPKKPGRPAKSPATETEKPKRKAGRTAKTGSRKSRAEAEAKTKRPPGRPKSQKTLEREALEAEMLARGEVPVKRGRGRPKGSKNKKTLEREAREAEMRANGELPLEQMSDRTKREQAGESASEADRPKRKPGRPKSRKTLEREAREAEMLARGEVPVKRGRGRPKGSKSKSTLEREAREAEMRAKGELPEKRGRGRPKGSKNRKTLEREAREAEMRALEEKGKMRKSGNKNVKRETTDPSQREMNAHLQPSQEAPQNVTDSCPDEPS